MIIKNGNELTARRLGNKFAVAIYKGVRLVWEAFTSLSAWFRSEGWYRSDPW